MQIVMKQPELEEAVRSYIASKGFSCDIGSISFTASRGPDGVVTEVATGDSASDGAGKKPPKKRATPPAPADKAPEPEAEEEVPDAAPAEEEEVDSETTEDAEEDKANDNSIFS